MVSPSHETETQSKRVSEFFHGPSGRANYDQLRLVAETMSARYKMLSGWAARSGQEFLHEAINCCYRVDGNDRCSRRIPAEIPVNVALIEIMKSLISHAYNSKGRRLAAEMPSVRVGGSSGDVLSFDPDKTMWSEGNDRLTPEEREDALSRVDGFLAFVKPDRVVYGILLLVRDEGLDRPASLLAERLGVSEIEIYQARKRLASAVTRYIKQQEAA